MKKGPFIFDSYALLKLFQKEKGYERIISLLAEIKKLERSNISMPSILEKLYT
jgi:hypothetical protein